jgi:hypothetical protein
LLDRRYFMIVVAKSKSTSLSLSFARSLEVWFDNRTTENQINQISKVRNYLQILIDLPSVVSHHSYKTKRLHGKSPAPHLLASLFQALSGEMNADLEQEDGEEVVQEPRYHPPRTQAFERFQDVAETSICLPSKSRSNERRQNPSSKKVKFTIFARSSCNAAESSI